MTYTWKVRKIVHPVYCQVVCMTTWKLIRKTICQNFLILLIKSERMIIFCNRIVNIIIRNQDQEIDSESTDDPGEDTTDDE